MPVGSGAPLAGGAMHAVVPAGALPAGATRGRIRRPPAGTAPGYVPIGVRVVRRIAALPDARLLDRLMRGRGWIALIGLVLMGVVFMQVSLLKLNTGIGRAIQTTATLERQNAELRGEVALLDGGERLQGVAAAMGMLMPPAGQVEYLDARDADPASAASRITPPSPVEQRPLDATQLDPADAAVAEIAGVLPRGAAAAATGTAAGGTEAGGAGPVTQATPEPGTASAPAGTPDGTAHTHPAPAASPGAPAQAQPAPAQTQAAPAQGAGGGVAPPATAPPAGAPAAGGAAPAAPVAGAAAAGPAGGTAYGAVPGGGAAASAGGAGAAAATGAPGASTAGGIAPPAAQG